MKDIRAIHNEAMELVKKANSLLEEGERSDYLSLIEQAFNLEQEASMELVLDFDSEPTRSVIFRSAANLAYICGKYAEADRLIHLALSGTPFEELKIEMLDIQDKIKQSLIVVPTKDELVDDAYFDWLRKDAIYFKVEPKTKKYSKAVAVNHIVDFLKNIQSSYKNFSEVQFLRNFQESDFNDFNAIFTSFKRDSNLLAVDVKFKSFGISLISDTQIMNYNEFYSFKYTELKKSLFNDFKEDVILPDFNNGMVQNQIKLKYSEEERRKIYTPIIPSLISKSPYQISISNVGFTKDVRLLKSLLPEAKNVLSPEFQKSNDDIEPNLISKIEQKKGRFSKTIHWEKLENAEIKETLLDIQCGPKKVMFKEPHSIIVAFAKGQFTINDEYFEIFIQCNDFDKSISEYKRNFIENYDTLLLKDRDSLNQAEIDLLDIFENSSLRDW